MAEYSFRENDATRNEAVTAVGTLPMNLSDAKYLLQEQNKLLKSRKTAIIIACSGLGTNIIGNIVYNAAPQSVAGPVVSLVGAAATLTGGIWLMVNEFKLIDNKRALNDVQLAAIPGGIALKF